MRLSEMSRARRATELEKIGTTTRFVLLDFQDATKNLPALRDEYWRCKSDEEREQLAFEWFEDHRQPVGRRDWLGSRTSKAAVVTLGGSDSASKFRTPDWPDGWLPGCKPAARAKRAKPRHRPLGPIPK